MKTWAIRNGGGETVALLTAARIERGVHPSQWLVKDQHGKWLGTLYTPIHLKVEMVSSEDGPAEDKSSVSAKSPTVL